MNSIPVSEFADKQLKVHHQKRERAVYYDDESYYKFWVREWEHSRVAQHGFKVGYYDDELASAFDSFIVDVDGAHLGYKMKKGESVGGSRDGWQNLIKKTSELQRKKFIKNIFQRSLEYSCLVSDMCPANVVICEGNISLIDYEGLGSFSWFFDSKPEIWEAQNRNLDKYPKPIWRDMSKYLRRYVEECLHARFDKDIKTEENFLELYHIVMEKTKNA